MDPAWLRKAEPPDTGPMVPPDQGEPVRRRRERHALAAIEHDLSADEDLLRAFRESVWPASPPAVSAWSRLGSLVLAPRRTGAAYVTCLVLQMLVAAGCALAAQTGRVWLVVAVMVFLPFTLTPLRRAGHAGPCRESGSGDPWRDRRG